MGVQAWNSFMLELPQLEPPHRWFVRRSPEAASMLLASGLNRLLAPRLSAVQRKILLERVVLIGFRRGGLDCRVCWKGGRFESCPPHTPADLAIRAQPADYLRLLTRETDADALFFQRRLRLEGDTALGLAIKNMLDAFELPQPVQDSLKVLAKISTSLPSVPKFLRD